MRIHTDLQTWLLDVGFDRIFRMWEYKRMFTPYEQQKAFMDEDCYVDSHAAFVKICEVIELPDGDVLIGFHRFYDAEDFERDNPSLEYKKLSQIELSYYPEDSREENWI